MGETVEVRVRIKLRYPLAEIGRAELRRHIAAATKAWGGQYHPDDPLFDGVVEVTTGAVEIVK